MSFNHGKGTKFLLDLADGTGPSDISTMFRSASGLEGKSERPLTTTFGASSQRRQLLGFRDGGPISLAGLRQDSGTTKIHGKSTRILMDQYAMHGFLRTATLRRMVDLPDTTVYVDTWRRRGLVGLFDGSLAFGGLFDGAAAALDVVMRAALAAQPASIISTAAAGFAIGNLVDLGQFVMNSYGISSPHDGAVEASADLSSEDQIDMGVSLHDLTAEVGTGNFASVNETAATSLGWVAHLHVTALTGSGCTIKIQDSADNSVWADLAGGTFTNVTAITKERLEGAATATVRQYVRAIISVMGAASITFQVSLARRGFTYGSAGTHRHLVGLYGKTLSSTFQYGPDGSVAGKPRFTGECRLSNLELSFPYDNPTTFTAELLTDGAITEDTF